MSNQEEVTKYRAALGVIVHDPRISDWLKRNDPKAWVQVVDALGEKRFTFMREHPGVLREFDKSDWMAFNGCESTAPLIGDDLAGCTIIIDGLSVGLYGPAQHETKQSPIYGFEVASEEEAFELAEALLAWPEPTLRAIELTHKIEGWM